MLRTIALGLFTITLGTAAMQSPALARDTRWEADLGAGYHGQLSDVTVSERCLQKLPTSRLAGMSDRYVNVCAS